MSSYAEVFGGSNIYPSQPSYLALALTADVELGWPIEQAPAGENVVSDIIDVTPSGAGLTITLGDATQVSTGYTALFNNVGAFSFNVLNDSGGVIATVASGTVWQLYLSDNTTIDGTWRSFQFGVGVSSATAAALAGAGLRAIGTTLNETIVINVQNADYVSTAADLATCLEWAGGTGTITLPSAAVAGAQWFVFVKNSGNGVVTVSPPTGTIDLAGSLAFDPDQSAMIICDGGNYFTIGYGQQLNSIFDFININLGGDSGTYTLTGAQLNRVSYEFTGALAGNITVVVPNTVQQYWVNNQTTGPYTLTVSATGGSSVTVGQGSQNILYCDGVNVISAISFGSTGFANGSAAAPSIFFTSEPASGFYSDGAGGIGTATNGTPRSLVSTTGHWTFDGSDDVTTPVITFKGPPSGPGVVVEISTATTQSGATPGLLISSTALSGFAGLSICADGFVPGTSDFFIGQASSTGGGGALIANNVNAPINFGIAGATNMTLSANGSLKLNGSIGILTLQGLTGGAATAGSSGALPATPAGYLVWTLGSGATIIKLPYYNA